MSGAGGIVRLRSKGWQWSNQAFFEIISDVFNGKKIVSRHPNERTTG
ncbi:hypothetical protein ACCUM_2919 [Candidatus Accumulibacter phosphatis]|uniref:Uncharacterized protein n=1 Tax=Candidatus Accumulibacter phosphatis TaxID=327160 RepID=A0A5S4EQ50_9PROT|nr:hypothetical protein ACCUM_2919 [Candidatus Accumulibacter phosphatis]